MTEFPKSAVFKTYDLMALSTANYARLKPFRLACGLLAVATTAIWGYVVFSLVEFGVARPDMAIEADLIAAVVLWVAYLCLTLAWAPIRFWSRPPVGLSIDATGLTFLLVDGSRRKLTWNDEELRIDVVVRPANPRTPPEARFRLFGTANRGDTRRPWRKVIPLTYVSEVAAKSIIAQARDAGAPVREDPSQQPVSLFSNNPGRLYQIGPRSD